VAKQKTVEESVGVGWVFWAIAFGILVGPFFYAIWQVRYEDVTPLFTVVVAVCLAALTAGFLSVGVNSLLHKRWERRNKTERKKSKKKRK